MLLFQVGFSKRFGSPAIFSMKVSCSKVRPRWPRCFATGWFITWCTMVEFMGDYIIIHIYIYIYIIIIMCTYIYIYLGVSRHGGTPNRWSISWTIGRSNGWLGVTPFQSHHWTSPCWDPTSSKLIRQWTVHPTYPIKFPI